VTANDALKLYSNIRQYAVEVIHLFEYTLKHFRS